MNKIKNIVISILMFMLICCGVSIRYLNVAIGNQQETIDILSRRTNDLEKENKKLTNKTVQMKYEIKELNK